MDAISPDHNKLTSMKRLLVLVALAVMPLLANHNDNKTMRLKKASSPIKVDGFIEAQWLQADSSADFFQQQPYHAQPPNRRTVARVLTTDEALYCLIIGYDQRENIQKTTGKLDDFGGDIVSIMLDTFGDNKTAYKFALTASGVT